MTVDDSPTRNPLFDGPAPDLTVTPPREVHAAVLDPFSVYQKGEALLRQELGALSAWHLVNIITTHRLSFEPESTLNRLPREALVDFIVAAVR
jgi:hypothetical protein